MNPNAVLADVREIVRQSEIDAVVREIRSGNRPYIGQLIDYDIQVKGTASCLFYGENLARHKKKTPFRLIVERWHLDAANRKIDESLL